MRSRNIALIALISLLALVAASCGGSDDTVATTDSPTATTEAPAGTEAPPATDPPQATTTAPSGDTTTTSGSGGPVELELSAIDNEGFNRNQLTVVAGAEVILTFVNKDVGGDPHNVHVRTDSDDWFTELKEGPDTQSITFSIGTPGEYEFFCDTHAETMKGDLIVEAP